MSLSDSELDDVWPSRPPKPLKDLPMTTLMRAEPRRRFTGPWQYPASVACMVGVGFAAGCAGAQDKLDDSSPLGGRDSAPETQLDGDAGGGGAGGGGGGDGGTGSGDATGGGAGTSAGGDAGSGDAGSDAGGSGSSGGGGTSSGGAGGTAGTGAGGGTFSVPAVGLPASLPPSGTSGTLVSSTGAAPAGTIADVDLLIDLDHTCTKDLVGVLQSPAGTRVTVFDMSTYPVCSADMVNTTVDDEAAGVIARGSSPFTGSYKPSSPLAALDGEDAAGVWTLTIEDRTVGDDGVLQRWSLDITVD